MLILMGKWKTSSREDEGDGQKVMKQTAMQGKNTVRIKDPKKASEVTC